MVREPCPACGGRLRAAGPLWVGELHDAAFLDSASEVPTSSKKHVSLFARAKEELGLPPYYFKIPFFTDSLGIPSVSPTDLAARLSGNGFRCTRSSVDSQGVKTDASVKDVLSALGGGQPRKPKPTK